LHLARPNNPATPIMQPRAFRGKPGFGSRRGLFAPPKEQEPLFVPNFTKYRDNEVDSDDEDDIDDEEDMDGNESNGDDEGSSQEKPT
jgi:hypothetical protein